MIYFRLKLYSEDNNKKDHSKATIKTLIVGGNIARFLPAIIDRRKLRKEELDREEGKKPQLSNEDKELRRDSSRLSKNLKKDALKSGINITNIDDFEGGSCYGVHRKLTPKEELKYRKKYLKSKRPSKNFFKNLFNNSLTKGIKSKMALDTKDLEGEHIILDKAGLKNAYVLAHEYGHAMHNKFDRDGSLVGKIAHKLNFSKLHKINKSIGRLGVSMGAGYKSYQDEKNNKDTKNDKLAVGINSGLNSLVTLTPEFEASRYAMKYLKKNGASKKYLGHSKKELGKAFMTYVGGEMIGAGKDIAGYKTGKWIAKKADDLKKKKENK